MSWVRWVLIVLVSVTLMAPATAQVSVTFDPPSINVGIGESAIVALRVAGVPPAGLAAFQARLAADETVVGILDPNRDFAALVPAFAPLGNDANCDTVRGQACTDPDWMLTGSGRTSASGLPDLLPADSDIRIVYGTTGISAPLAGDGAIALIEVTGVAEGSTTVSFAQLILASADEPPLSHSVVLFDLQVTVGATIDTDGDGVVDSLDNCIEDANEAQVDSDADGYGNACDLDFNNDNIINFLDLAPLVDAFFSVPGDANWNPDADTNNDGVINFLDFVVFQMKFLQAPGPSGVASRPAPNLAGLTSESVTAENSQTPFLDEAPVVWLAESLHTVVGAPVSLDASHSYDVRGDRISFSWDVVGGPSTSEAVTLALTQSFSPVARFVPPQPGEYVLRCRVTDGAHVSEARVVVTAHELTAPKNALIKARNSWSTSTRVGSRVFLRTASAQDTGLLDVDDRWLVLRAGEQINATDSTDIDASVVELPDGSAYFVSGAPGNFEVSLERTTSEGSDRAVLLVRVNPGDAVPTAKLSATLTSSGSVHLSRSGAPVLRQQWRMVSRPKLSQLNSIDINRSTFESASFIPDVQGQYVLRFDYVGATGAGFEQIFIDTGAHQ